MSTRRGGRRFPAFLIWAVLCGSLLSIHSPSPRLHSQTQSPPVRLDQHATGSRFNDPPVAAVHMDALSEIPIGLFAPNDPSDPASVLLYRGILIGLEQVNRAGGFGGKPFVLKHRWVVDPWRGGSREVIHLVYRDRVFGIIAYRGGAAHVAQQVAARVFVPVVAPLTTAPSLTRTGVPWIFRIPPDDEQLAPPAVAPIIAASAHSSPSPAVVGIIAGTDHDSRSAAAAVKKALVAGQVTPAFFFTLNTDAVSADFRDLSSRVLAFRPDHIIYCLPLSQIPSLLSAGQRAGVTASIHVSWVPGLDIQVLKPLYSSPLFAPPPPAPPLTADLRSFYASYRRQYKTPPPPAAVYGYTALHRLAAAVITGGLHRPAVRRALQKEE